MGYRGEINMNPLFFYGTLWVVKMISASVDTHLGFSNRNRYFCLSVRLMTRDVIHRKIIFSLLRNLKVH